MKFVRQITIACVVVAAWWGTRLPGCADEPVSADEPGARVVELPKPPGKGASRDATARWIRKMPPPAPTPDVLIPPAPIPEELRPPLSIIQRMVRRSAEPMVLPAPVPVPRRPVATVPPPPPLPIPAQSNTKPTPLPSAPPPSTPPQSGLTLVELEQIAATNNPTLAQAAARIEATRGKWVQAGLYPNPTIGYESDDVGEDGSAGQHGVFIGQRIVTAGKLQHRSAVVSHEVLQAELAWQAQSQRVLNDLRSTFYEVLVAQEVIRTNEQLVEVARQGVTASENLRKALEVGDADVLQFQIEADSAGLQLSAARYRHLSAWRRLSAVLGQPEMQPAQIAGDLQGDLRQLDWQTVLSQLLTGSPELADAQVGVQRARSAVGREFAQRVPDVDVRATVRYNDAVSNTVAGIEVGIPLPLFDRNQGNICKAEAQLMAAESEVRRVELSLQQRLATTFSRYTDSREQVEKYTADILPKAKRSLDLVRKGLKQGEFDYLTLLTAQRTHCRVNLAYLEALLKYRSSKVAIEGLLLDGGLTGQAPME
ncbi:MAG: TolC family protein [Candidatus Nealsonbacteria bacterium]|nr:TolC family protein [Candidatus Nealsonbacteria bacterium]